MFIGREPAGNLKAFPFYVRRLISFRPGYAATDYARVILLEHYPELHAAVPRASLAGGRFRCQVYGKMNKQDPYRKEPDQNGSFCPASGSGLLSWLWKTMWEKYPSHQIRKMMEEM